MNAKSDYSELANLKTAKQKAEESKRALIDVDINKISEAIAQGEEVCLKAVHREIDGKYQACIRDWGMSMYNYSRDLGFDYEYMGKESLTENLELMKAKLESYKEGRNECLNDTVGDRSGVSVVLNNNISIEMTFEQAKQKIEDMPGLTQQDTEDIQNKISALEEISRENSPKKKKWEKVKPIIAFALDKGADVAITIMGLVMQMKLGM